MSAQIIGEVVEMRSRWLFRGFVVFGALVFVAALAVGAGAQPAPLQVVQGIDGTLYLVQGGAAWTLVPIQLGDAQVAALNINGEVDGNIPANLLSAPVPSAPAPATPEPPAAAPAPAPALAAPPVWAPITGKADLTGRASNNIESATPISVGATITSVVDYNTKPSDFFSIALSAGVTYRFIFSSPTSPSSASGVYPLLLDPDGTPSVTGLGTLPLFTPASNGTYYLQMNSFLGTVHRSGLKYTFSVKSS